MTNITRFLSCIWIEIRIKSRQVAQEMMTFNLFCQSKAVVCCCNVTVIFDRSVCCCNVTVIFDRSVEVSFFFLKERKR